jgi:hypothetical protein
MNVRDRRYLLCLVREQQARLDMVYAVASDLAERGERMEDQLGRGGNSSTHTIRAAGLGDGYREAARSIRAALDPAMKGRAGGEAIATAVTRRTPTNQPEADAPTLPPDSGRITA